MLSFTHHFSLPSQGNCLLTIPFLFVIPSQSAHFLCELHHSGLSCDKTCSAQLTEQSCWITSSALMQSLLRRNNWLCWWPTGFNLVVLRTRPSASLNAELGKQHLQTREKQHSFHLLQIRATSDQHSQHSSTHKLNRYDELHILT